MIKFFIIPPPLRSYSHNIVCLAEGFKALNIPYCGNIDYWYDQEKKGHLIKKGDFPTKIQIFSSSYFEHYPEALNQLDTSKVNALVDNEDGLFTSAYNKKYKKFDLILRCHYNEAINKAPNVYPWAFGLSNRITTTIDKFYKPNTIPATDFLSTFRLNHATRAFIVKGLDQLLMKKYPLVTKITDPYAIIEKEPEDDEQSYRYQTGYRHDEYYYKNLNQHLFSHASGGFFSLKTLSNNLLHGMPRFIDRKIAKKFTSFYKPYYKTRTHILYQYDSWRFWESMYSKTIPIHLDLKSWNCTLPEMPINGLHYLGIKESNLNEFAEKVLSLSKGDLNDIILEGRKWVNNNYTPVPTTKRFLNLVDSLN